MPRDRPGEMQRSIRDLERFVMESMAARTLENASIGARGITVEGAAHVLFKS
ncbi:MAG TPA: hypothetical protein VGN48_17940 [Pedococcus sp.]|jgi:hypothetical protein|nr:hypothetical protein [Pedococcus sp.]